MFQPKELFIRAYSVSLSAFELEKADVPFMIACPDPPIEALEAGRAIAVPHGEFDVDLILNQLPATFHPEIVTLSARDLSFRPNGLEKFNCPKVMKIGDTFHWEDGSLRGIIDYCKRFQCDYHYVYQGVQHLHFFVEAGLKNVFWLPGTLAIAHYVPQPPAQKSYDVIFRGSESALHVQRTRLLNAVRAARINLDVQRKSYHDCLEDYPKAHVVLNCSLNGDTNRRVFEVLMAGGFLLTDRLSPQSGLFTLFQEGIHLECYGSDAELIEKINFYLQHPEKAAQIAAAGQQKLLDCYSQQAMQQTLYRYILTNKIDPPFRLEHDRRISSQKSKTLETRLNVYELIQEIHQSNAEMKLLYWRGRDRELLSDLADMPRLTLTYAQAHDELDQMKAWCDRAGVSAQVQFNLLDPNESDLNEQFQMAIVDGDGSIVDLKPRLEGVLPYLVDGGLLIVLGNPNLQTRGVLNWLLSTHHFTSVCLGVKTAHGTDKILGAGAYLVYQNRIDASAVEPLAVHKISLQTQLRQHLKALPVVHHANRFVRQSLLKRSS